LFGGPIHVRIEPSLGAHWAATHIPHRVIRLDAAVLRKRGEFDRILVHEIFHFVWVRLGNPARRAWETLLAEERKQGVQGELGWSAELRQERLKAQDVRGRTPRWRHYACESFCDTAAWLYAGGRHPEFTLARAARERRKRWFTDQFREGANC
jgi:hypothetical protein